MEAVLLGELEVEGREESFQCSVVFLLFFVLVLAAIELVDTTLST